MKRLKQILDITLTTLLIIIIIGGVGSIMYLTWDPHLIKGYYVMDEYGHGVVISEPRIVLFSGNPDKALEVAVKFTVKVATLFGSETSDTQTGKDTE